MVYCSGSEAETRALGEKVTRLLKPCDIIAVVGEMGAGKTVFVQGLACGLGFDGRVTSPTYTIVNEYPTVPPLFHFDLFRLNSADELYEIGFDDYLARGGICAIEWFENAESEYEWDVKVVVERDEENVNHRKLTVITRGKDVGF